MSNQNYKNHIIICNWNKLAIKVIEQLKRIDPDLVILIISNYSNDTIKQEIEGKKGIFLVDDNPADKDVLKSNSLLEARGVILLSDKKSTYSDQKNILIALVIQDLEENENKGKDIHVIAELNDTKYKKHLLNAKVDEIISYSDYSAGILAQSALYYKMADIFHDLLSYSKGTNEIYYIDIFPSIFYGKKFSEILTIINQHREEIPIILIGIIRNEKIMINPKGKIVIKENDKLIVLSYEPICEIKYK